jgi:tetratricopeptide (TPR) repeat protein
MMEPNMLQHVIEKYVEGGLKGEKLKEFQQRLLTNPSVADEVQLSFEINEAIKEKDIMKIRKNLEKVAKDEGMSKKKNANEDARFGLADEMEEFINLEIGDEDFGDIGNFLQKLHLRNHTIASKETIHEVYRKDEMISENDYELLSEEDELIISNVQQAVAEHDIMDLRANLKSISQSISAHNWKSEDIEDFVSGDIGEEYRMMIENEALVNLNLADDINLYNEINEAVGEKDIRQLRAALDKIMEFESSHNRSVDEIEDYLNQELEESLMNSFEEELLINEGLVAEVKLNQEINDAIGEKDIMALRESLKNIKDSGIDTENQHKHGISAPKLRRVVWYAAAASIILLLGLNVTFQNHSYSNPELYNEYYHPVEANLGATRSASLHEERLLNQALVEMNNKEYDSALKLFSEILQKDGRNIAGNFYTGTIRQQTGKYEDAIHSFTNVITQGDNLFVEQSEWFIGLCYLNRNEREKAIRQFRKISKSNGYYQQQSKAILKKLE